MHKSEIKCLMMHTGPYRLLLPYGAIAHIAYQPKINPVSDDPVWHIGYHQWQQHTIHVIDFKRLLETDTAPKTMKTSYLVILESFSQALYIGLIADKVPQSLLVTPDAMIEQNAYPENPLMHYCVLIQNERVLIPNTQLLERTVGGHTASLE